MPPRVDNSFRGHKLGLVLFGLLVALNVIMNVRAILGGYAAATADGIPLNTFTAAAAQAYVLLFALFGLSELMLCVVCILALVRYRALVPCLFVLFLLEFLCRRLILAFLIVERTGTSVGTIINLGLFILMLVGLVLSLWRQRQPFGETVV